MPPRKPVPEPWASKLVDVQARLKATRRERDETIVEALKAGGSIREVADLIGLNHRQVLEIGHAAGWPPDDQRARRAAERRQAGIERKIMEEHRRSAEFQEALRRYEKTPELIEFERKRAERFGDDPDDTGS